MKTDGSPVALNLCLAILLSLMLGCGGSGENGADSALETDLGDPCAQWVDSPAPGIKGSAEADQEDRDNEDQREGNIDDRVEQRTLEYVAHAIEIAQPHDLGADRCFGQHRIWKMQDALKGLVADNRINPSAEIGL